MKNIDILKDVQKIDTIETNVTQNTTDITNIQTDLSVTENSKYTTINGVKEFECGNGYVDNVLIEGNTLINIFNSNVEVSSDRLRSNVIYSVKSFTLINLSNKRICQTTSKDGVYYKTYSADANSSKYITLEEVETLSGTAFLFSDGWTSSDLELAKKAVIILEGNHTSKTIPYFEGLKSIGQGEKIEVLTNNGNYHIGFDKYGGFYMYENGQYATMNGFNSGYSYSYPNTKYFLANIHSNITFWTKDDKFISGVAGSVEFITTPNNCYKIRYAVQDGKSPYIGTNEFDISKKYKTDKKQILTTLRGLPNGVKDTIYKQGEKYYKNKKCKETTFNGSETGWTLGGSLTNTCLFYLSGSGLKGYSSGNCDKFKVVQSRYFEDGIDEECIYIAPGKAYCILINKTKANTLEGFKTWLSNNNITFVGELETYENEELPNFNPRTFSDKTTILINSGVVQGEASFEVTNSLGSELEVLKSKATVVEDGLLNNIYGFQAHKLTNDNSYCFNMEEINIDNLTQSGFYRVKNPSGLPVLGTVNWYHIFVFQQSANYCLQLAYSMTSKVYFTSYYRIMDNNSWQPWQKVATTSTLSLMEQQISELEIQAMENEV